MTCNELKTAIQNLNKFVPTMDEKEQIGIAKNVFVSILKNYKELLILKEKNIPKKLILDEQEQLYRQKCPNCGIRFLYKEYLSDEYNHCPNCGQALDWSDEQ